MQIYLERDAFCSRLHHALQRQAPTALKAAALTREFNRRYAGAPITLHAARRWLLGEAIPAQDKLRVLADWLGVTAEWLRFGQGQAIAQIREPDTAVDYQLMREITALSEAHRQVVREMIKLLKRAESSNPA
jgi:hypothetical protein